MALERTMMARLRTAVSLIGFGFAIVPFSSICSRCPGSAPPNIRTRWNIWSWR
ncbi:MAG: DUF202 domain-containing protein [Alphaproteobacteria bacterium]|nr:DUF202 domain-containing protein [Alphaproteobacteria bacterium]